MTREYKHQYGCNFSRLFQCDCGKDLNTTDYIYHYVHHKDLTVGLGDGKELKEKVIRWIQHSPDEERAGFGEVMLWKQMMLNEWLDKFGAPDGLVDELALYVMSQLLWEPIAVITKTQFWSSVEGGEDFIGEMKIMFAFGGEGRFIPLERAEDKEPGIVLPIIFTFVLISVFCVSGKMCHKSNHINICIKLCINYPTCDHIPYSD